MIIGFFGKPRSGKTTALASIVAKSQFFSKINSILDRLHVPKGLHFLFIRLSFRFPAFDKIYSTEFIKGTIMIRPYDIGKFDPGENSLIVLGEAGTYFNNRLSSKIPSWCTDFFALHGHYGCTIIWDSQTVDVDKKLRNRTELLYHVRKGRFLRQFSFQRRIWYDVTVNNDTQDLCEGYSISSGLMKPIHYLLFINKILYRPLFYRYFDSFNKPIVMSLDPAKFKEW